MRHVPIWGVGTFSFLFQATKQEPNSDEWKQLLIPSRFAECLEWLEPQLDQLSPFDFFCGFWKKREKKEGLPLKYALILYGPIKFAFFLTLYVFGSCFTTLAVIHISEEKRK